MADRRTIHLRYPAVCSECGSELAPGTEALWDRAARTATCTTCTTKPFDRGTAGASSLRRYDRLHDAREARAKERFGRFSGVYLRLSEEPRTTRAWAVGGRGEERLGRFLETLHDGETLVVLHDRRIPRRRANIDHIAVSANGVFVIDAKNYAGKVRRIDKGGWFSSDERLYVGRRDCTKLVTDMGKQFAAVREALGDATISEFELEVTPVVCFVAAEWTLFAKPFRLGSVWIEWPQSLGRRLAAPGPLSPEHVQTLAKRVAAALPAYATSS
jgi:Nuclease-related domain